MGEIRDQVDQAMAGAGYLDPDSPEHGELHRDADRNAAIVAGIAGLIAAVRILADRLDQH